MTRRRVASVPGPLEDLRRRFERWRRRRKGRPRIPQRLWAAAVRMARRYGVHRTARTLRLDYYSLKERVEAQADGDGQGPRARGAVGESLSGGEALPRGAGQGNGVTFLELPSGWGASGSEGPAGGCRLTVELEGGPGAKVRLRLEGSARPGWVVPASEYVPLG